MLLSFPWVLLPWGVGGRHGGRFDSVPPIFSLLTALCSLSELFSGILMVGKPDPHFLFGVSFSGKESVCALPAGPPAPGSPLSCFSGGAFI